MKLEALNNSYVDHYNELKGLKEAVRPKYTMSDHSIFMVDYKDVQNFSEGNKIEYIPFDIISFLPTGNVSFFIKDFVSGMNVILHHCISTDMATSLPSLHVPVFLDVTDKDMHNLCFALLCYLVTKLNEKETYVGIKNVEMRKKSGQTIIKPVTYISTKKNLAKDKKAHGDGVDWKHSWEVIGHWRVCKTIGKDRDGVYNQVGKTWVSPAIRGKGELIKKIRII